MIWLVVLALAGGVVPGQIVSYKLSVQETGRLPPGARLVCFHGHPRPWEIQEAGLTRVEA